MPKVPVNGIELFYHEAGHGVPLLLAHEFAGDCRGLEAQFDHFSQLYRCIAYNSRGYAPSTVPTTIQQYSFDAMVADMGGMLDALLVKEAHLLGYATGAGVALSYALDHPERVRSLTLVGLGSGAVDSQDWRDKIALTAGAIADRGVAAFVDNIVTAPQRQAFRYKNPSGWATFVAQMRELSAEAVRHMILNIQMKRPSIYSLRDRIASLAMPVFVVVGDQDVPAFDASVFVSRTVRHGALAVLPASGHMVPQEEPAKFNMMVEEFLSAADLGQWNIWSK